MFRECWPGIGLGGGKTRINREESGTKSVRIGGVITDETDSKKPHT